MGYCILKSYKLEASPQDIFEAFKDKEGCFFLDTSLRNPLLGRYSFLGSNPFAIIKTDGTRDFFQELADVLEKYNVSLRADIPFLGGAVGYFSYDLGFFIEEKFRRLSPKLDIPLAFFGLYNNGVVIDHYKKSYYIFSLGLPERKSYLASKLAFRNFRRIEKTLSSLGKNKTDNKIGLVEDNLLRLKSDFTKSKYIQAVLKAKEYIKKGDIYQVNLAQQFQAQTSLSSLQIYNNLRRLSPSSFAGYFDAGDFQILSSSPERFLNLSGRKVFTRPMKGTRPRGEDRKKDIAQKKELLLSKKDKAELMMIVDLERNDLGRVCDYDSIKVERLRNLEKYSTVFQTTASICGNLHKDKNRIDLLRACFPGGSITGCPKIRAMEIIDELEPRRRGLYTGSLGYLGFNGRMDLNILIRTILKKGNNASFGVGGGIVADSCPQKEYEETLVKARAMMQALVCS